MRQNIFGAKFEGLSEAEYSWIMENFQHQVPARADLRFFYAHRAKKYLELVEKVLTRPDIRQWISARAAARSA